MRIEGGIEPLLRCGRRIRGTENSGYLRKGLVIIDEGAAPVEIGPDDVPKQLYQRLPVAQNA